MRVSFHHYKSGYRIVSLAFDESVKQDLLEDRLDFLFISSDAVELFPDETRLTISQGDIDKLCSGSNYDVWEIMPDGAAYRRYDSSSIDNFFFVTDRCNSNCIMCPAPEALRKNCAGIDIQTLIELAKHIPSDVVHLTVTGGEPFMAGLPIFDFFQFLQQKFQNTEFLILTNGRIFAVDRYAGLMGENQPGDCTVGIPLYGASADVHDFITRAPGSFKQTVTGIKNLISHKVQVELRIVVSKLNIGAMENLARFIVRELRGIDHVCIMATEMTGNANKNKDMVWIPYSEAFQASMEAIMLLIRNGVDVKLYNFPLCTVKKEFWTLCEKSISSDKVRYGDCCSACSMSDACGGVFAGTLNFEKNDLRALE